MSHTLHLLTNAVLPRFYSEAISIFKILFGVWPHILIVFTGAFWFRIDVTGLDNWGQTCWYLVSSPIIKNNGLSIIFYWFKIMDSPLFLRIGLDTKNQHVWPLIVKAYPASTRRPIDVLWMFGCYVQWKCWFQNWSSTLRGGSLGGFRF